MRCGTSEPVKESGSGDIDDMIFSDMEYEISRR